MSHRFLITMGAISCFLFTLSWPAQASIIAHYSFDSNFEDDTSSKNHLVVSEGTPTITNTVGEFVFGGGSLDTDSTVNTREYLDLTDPISFSDTDPWSIAFWARRRPGTDFRTGMIVGDTGNSTDFIWIPDNPAQVQGLRFRNSTSNDANFDGYPDDGQFHHWVVISDGAGSITSFRDNVQQSTVAIPGTFNITSVAHGYNSTTHSMDGQIDELYIFNEAIDAAAVNTLYSGKFFTSVQTGNWNLGTTWDGGGLTPVNDCDVFTTADHVVTIGSSAEARHVSVEDTSVLLVNSSLLVEHKITVAGGATLNLNGQLAAAQLITASSNNITPGSTITLSNSLTLDSSLDMTGSALNVSPADIIINSGATLTYSNLEADSVTVNSGGTLNLNGALTTKTLTVRGGSLDHATMTFAVVDFIFDNYTVNFDMTGTSNATCQGNTVNLNAAQTYTGSTNVTGGTLNINVPLTTSSELNVSGGTASVNSSGSVGTSKITVSDSGVLNINPGATVTATSVAVSDAGVINTTSNELEITGSLDAGGFVLSATSGSFKAKGSITASDMETLDLNGATVTVLGHVTPNLVGEWLFENDSAESNPTTGVVIDTADYTTGAHNGSVRGTPVWSTDVPTGIRSTKSIDLNLDDAAIVIDRFLDSASEDDFDLAQGISVVLWTKEMPDADFYPFVSKGSQIWQMRRVNNHASFMLAGTSGNDRFEGNIDIDNNNWKMLVGTYDGVTRKLYVDGVLDRSQLDTGDITTTDSTVVFGARDTSDNNTNPATLERFSHVWLDDVRIFDGDLSEAEIVGLMSGVVPIPGSGVKVSNLTGDGTIISNVYINGIISPGNGIGTINVDGHLILNEGATYEWELGELTNDLVHGTGELNVGNWNLVVKNGGGSAEFTDELLLFNFSSLPGQEPLAYDLNGDATVNDQDLNLLLSAFNTSYDENDLNSLLEEFGSSLGTGVLEGVTITTEVAGWDVSGASVQYDGGNVFLTGISASPATADVVPEPGSLVLLLLAIMCVIPVVRARK